MPVTGLLVFNECFFKANSDKEEVNKAIEDWQQHTCLKFHQYQPGVDTSYVYFRDGLGCSSSVGHQKRNLAQSILLSGTCRRVSIRETTISYKNIVFLRLCSLITI